MGKNIKINSAIKKDVEEEAENFIVTMIENKIPSSIEISGYGGDIKKDDIVMIEDKTFFVPYKRKFKIIEIKKENEILKLKLERINDHKTIDERRTKWQR